MITGILIGDGRTRKSQWQVAKFRGKPLLLHPIRALQTSDLDEIILVLGRDYHLILNRVKMNLDKTRIVMNRRFDRGLSSYIRTGLSLIPPRTEAVLIALGEYPLLKSATLNRMIDFFKKDKAGILVPVYEGQAGKPYIFSSKYIKHLKKITGDDIGETVINKFSRDVHKIEVKNPGVIKGLDRIKELETIDSGEIDREEKKAAAKDKPSPPPDEKKKIADKIKQKIENMGKPAEEKAKEKSEKTTLKRPGFKPSSKPGEPTIADSGKNKAASVEKERKEATGKPQTAKTGKKQDRQNVQSEEGKDISLKMLNDLLGKGSKKFENGKIEPAKKEQIPAQKDSRGRPEKISREKLKFEAQKRKESKD